MDASDILYLYRIIETQGNFSKALALAVDAAKAADVLPEPTYPQESGACSDCPTAAPPREGEKAA